MTAFKEGRNIPEELLEEVSEIVETSEVPGSYTPELIELQESDPEAFFQNATPSQKIKVTRLGDDGQPVL